MKLLHTAFLQNSILRKWILSKINFLKIHTNQNSYTNIQICKKALWLTMKGFLLLCQVISWANAVTNQNNQLIMLFIKTVLPEVWLIFFERIDGRKFSFFDSNMKKSIVTYKERLSFSVAIYFLCPRSYQSN